MEEKKEIPWIIHAVAPTLEEINNKTNISDHIVFHTHGLKQYNNNLELELNLPINTKQAMQFINLIGYAIAFKGLKVEHGTILKEKTLFSCEVAFVEVEPIYGDDDNTKVLRIIFPDKNFRFPWDIGCEEPYASQI